MSNSEPVTRQEFYVAMSLLWAFIMVITSDNMVGGAATAWVLPVCALGLMSLNLFLFYRVRSAAKPAA